MLYRGNPVEAAPGMVFFRHMTVFDGDRGLAMSMGRNSPIGAAAAEPPSRAPTGLVVV